MPYLCPAVVNKLNKKRQCVRNDVLNEQRDILSKNHSVNADACMKQSEAMIRKENVRPTWRFPGLIRSSMIIHSNVESVEGGAIVSYPAENYSAKSAQ
jgi:hypothetical protein